MRRTVWLTLGLALTAAAAAPPTTGAEAEPRALGKVQAYETLSRLPVLHEGRIKPLDTLAREEVKQIFGRETIKLLDARQGNRVVETWAPVAALLDWSVRPEFWDDQPFLLVEYVPLKRLILADALRARLQPVDRAAADRLAGDPDLSAETLRKFLARADLKPDDRKALDTLAAELSEEHKWLTPRQLEEAKVVSESGERVPFEDWFRDLVQKKRKADATANGSIRLTDVEKRAIEAGTRLVHYQAIRDRTMDSVEPMLVMPRPSNKEYLAFLGRVFDKAKTTRDMRTLPPLELDAVKTLFAYMNELQGEDRAKPGTSEEFDRPFAAWLKESSAWVPLKVLLDTKAEELAEAGFPADKVTAFQKAFQGLEKAETDAPGRVSEDRADALVKAARSLGEANSATIYPSVAAIDRETYFNDTNPFYKAPAAYALAVALLAACLGFQGFESRSSLARAGKGLYALGMLGLVAGIVYEAYGFYLRVLISGWAPVTNMYETVIWVSAVSAVLGLVFELVYRKTYAALAGSGVALLGTVLAANVPLLDPDIKTLTPVLRSNYWLTIHVLTEVSSYGAFLMAAGLGLIATVYYLTATYRRSPSFTELLLPLAPGLPLLAIGSAGLMASNGYLGTNWVSGSPATMLVGAVAGVGGIMTLMALISAAGEAYSRLTFRDDALPGELPEPATPVPPTTPGAKPTVAEIRAMAAAGRPKLDARSLAMQETASKIKPLSNFIYRTMQVGVLLIAAGTILGGIWADYSWGRFWGWDPKEVWALITLLVYLIPLHGRFAGWFNTFALVVASVVCSLSVIMAWYGVNFVLGVGLHSYGFVEGGGQGVVMATIAAVMALPAAAWWRRRLGSRAVLETA